MSAERWLPVVGFSGYEVSDQGRVLSRKRYHGSDGPRPMSTPSTDEGYLEVHLQVGASGSRVVRVHILVLEAFVGPCPEGLQVRHLDGDPSNNKLGNLRYGTPSENVLDQVRHGTHPFASRTSCKHGHEYTPENTAIWTSATGRPFRSCKTCHHAKRRRQRAARAA